MALHLPDCLRWDYGEPYPKSFILCGNVIHYWNGGETEGHVEEIEAKREPGLDLLLVVSKSSSAATPRPRSARRKVSRSRCARPSTASSSPRRRSRSTPSSIVWWRFAMSIPKATAPSSRSPDYQAGVKTGTFNPPKDVKWLDEY